MDIRTIQQGKIQDTRIVVCDRCKGEGTIMVATGEADHYREEPCPQCGGTRVMKRILTIEYQPLNNLKNENGNCKN